MKHKHSELIKLWADGAQIEYLQEASNTWIDCIDNKPLWVTDIQYRVKPQPLQAWQEELVNAINEGKLVEYFDNNCWHRAASLEFNATMGDTSGYKWRDRKDYRIRLQQWQIDLVTAIRAGDSVEVCVDLDTWARADILHRLTQNNELEHYEWKPKGNYRVKPRNLYMWAYETGNSWYVFSKLMSEAEVKAYAHKLGIEKYRKILTISDQ